MNARRSDVSSAPHVGARRARHLPDGVRSGVLVGRAPASVVHLLGVAAFCGVATLAAQSGDPAFDPPPGAPTARSSTPRVASRSVDAPWPIAGLARFAILDAGVRPARIAPGDAGRLRVVLSPRGPAALDWIDPVELQVAVDPALARLDGGERRAVAGDAHVLEMPLVVASDAAPGRHRLSVELIADVAGQGRRTATLGAELIVAAPERPRSGAPAAAAVAVAPAASHPEGTASRPPRADHTGGRAPPAPAAGTPSPDRGGHPRRARPAVPIGTGSMVGIALTALAAVLLRRRRS